MNVLGTYVIATTKSWNIDNVKKLRKKYSHEEFYLITDKNELVLDFLDNKKPEYIFFPHWSWIIPPEIYEKYKCVVFHMTDLPFGRGGSPLQNLIVRGIYETKVSAIAVENGVDTGPVYFKEPINISQGNADCILTMISDIIFEKMIPRFILDNPKPSRQVGEEVVFKRRTEKDSKIPEGLTQRQIYDYIRMLDGEGYPLAYKDVGDLRIYFKNARLQEDQVVAETIITRR